MDNEIGIVVAFITRETAGKRQLVVFRKPRAGNQLLVGGVEDGETPENALLRVIREQSNLDAEIVAQLDSVEQVLQGKDRVLSGPFDLEVEPGDAGRRVARLQRGSPVLVIEHEMDYTHVWYNFVLENGVLIPHKSYTGWLPSKFLSDRTRTYLFQVKTSTPTEDQWTYKVNDFRSTEFYWADMDVELIPPHRTWLDRVRDRLK